LLHLGFEAGFAQVRADAIEKSHPLDIKSKGKVEMKAIVRVLVIIGLVMVTGPDKAVAQWGEVFRLGVVGNTDEASDANADPEEQERQKQLGIKLAKKEKEALFELQKSIFILEKMTEIGSELVTAQMESNYGVFTDGEKFNKLIISMSNLSEVLKDESQVVHDIKLFLKVKVDKIEKNSARMRGKLDQKKKESENLMEIVNARSSKVPKLLVDKFYPALRNNAKEVNVKLKSSIKTINKIMSATTYKSLTEALKMDSGGLGIANGISNFSETMDEFNEYKGSIEEMSVSLLDYIDASKKLHEEGLVLLEEAHKRRTEEARLKQDLKNIPDQEELENLFVEEDIQVAALDDLGQSMEGVWEMPIEDVLEGDYKEDLAMQIAEAENIPEISREMESSLPKREAANKPGDGSGVLNFIESLFGGGETETVQSPEPEAGFKDDSEEEMQDSEFEQETYSPTVVASVPKMEADNFAEGGVQTVVVEIFFEPETQDETEMLSTVSLESFSDSETDVEEVVQVVEAGMPSKSDPELEQEFPASAEEAGMEPDLQNETLSTAKLLPASEGETVEEEIDVVSQVAFSADNPEDSEPINPVGKEEPSHENMQVAKLEPTQRQETVDKEMVDEETVDGYACVQSMRVNLRNGPGKNYQKLAQVKIYTPFERLKKTGAWVKIRTFKNETFWVYQTLITEKYTCGTVNQDNVDFYTQPDFNSFPFYGAPMNVGFSVRILSLDNENDWVKVLDSAKNISWVQKSMLWIR
jgi:SH3-like domain-containing protein